MAQAARAMRDFRYQPERGRFRDWLGTVAHNKLVNHLRGARRPAAASRGEGATEPEAVGDPGPGWAAEFHAGVLGAALERIRPHFEAPTWRAFELSWLEGRPAPEAARELGVAIDAVYVAKSRVLKRLREEVVALAEDLPLYVPLG